MSTTLTTDQSRCHGFCCPLRERCLRYRDRASSAEIAPLMSHLCEQEGRGRFLHYIGVSREAPAA